MTMNMQRKQITTWALGLLILSFWMGATGAWAGTITVTEDQTPYANKGSGSVTITPAPPYVAAQNATIVATPNAGSYFFRWSGDKITEQNQYSRTNVIAVGEDDTVTIQYLFSGEVGATDNGFGDLDNDALADFWEINAGLDPTTANGSNGKYGNQDGDLIPTSVGGWPLTGLRLLAGYNTGAPFNNFFEQSGFDGHWDTNYPGPWRTAGSDDPATSATDADSDNDGLPDGWEYYFWYWRGAGASTHGGTPLAWVGLDPIVGNDPSGDTDGDGLTDIAEYNAGTDPTHCDTDRDGMDDKWEVDNLLNPLDPNDASGGNPDGDKMAYDGIRFHDSVYRKGGSLMEAGETAFDPRTSWADGTNVTGTAHPDTADYSNIHEYLGRDRQPRIFWDRNGPNDGRRVADGADDATNPQSSDTDGDGVPDGWELYVGMNPKDANDAGNDRDVNADKGDGLNNAEEWRNARAAGGNADALGTWTNKLWPTDPGHIQDGTTYGEGNIVFAWRNVWMSGETNVVYSQGVDTPVFYGGLTNNIFSLPNGAVGTNAGLYYNDANDNLRWDFGEDIWKISSSYDNVTNQVYAGGDAWTTDLGKGGRQDGLYYYDGNGDGSYSPGEEIWRNELNVYNTNRDMAVWGGGHSLGFRTPHGAVGRGLTITDPIVPMYYDWFINLYVAMMWSKPGDTNMATLPFDPATDTVWLDIGANGVFDGEQMVVGARPPVGTRGLGLAYVFVESSSNYWIDRSGVVGTYDASDVLLAGTPGGPGSPAPSIVFWDANNDQMYTAGEVIWKDTVVADSLYTHDYQVYNTNAVLISGGHRGSQIGMYFYHNDPHPADTDFDGLEDGEGKAYYSNIPFGEKNLLANPTTVDSDTDALPDGWEAYAGTQILVPDASPGQAQGVTVPEEADDETVLLLGELEVGPLEDPDGDGLVNNQEYLTGLNYEWMHIDIWKFPNTKLGTRTPMAWDRKAEGGNTSMRVDWIPVFIPPDFPTCPSFIVDNGQRARLAEPYVFYHTTRADKADTDDDGMDDYWEIYHGLNPLKGAADYLAVPTTTGTRKSSTGAQTGAITVTNDFSDSPHLKFGTSAGEFSSLSNLVKALQTLSVGGHVGPFNMGLELMDPDADGLPNLEEYSYEPGDTGRSFYHTDPTAFIRTDVATGFKAFVGTREQIYSFTRENYTIDNIPCPCKWKWKKDTPAYPFAFEEVEGFDTDNDGYGDFAELNSSLPNATGGSDPIDSRDPVKNRALFLVATNQDFVRTLDSWVVNIENHLTRFTVEAWVMPTATGQVWQTAVERDTQLPADWFGSLTRSNFRLGLTTNNLPYVMYNGRGPLESSWTFSPASYRVPANKWSHLAATYDGQKVRLYVNGVLAFVTDSEIIPATGYNDRLAQRKLSTTIVGAREPDNTNDLWGAPSVLFNDTLLSGEPCYGTAGFSLFSLSLQAERAVPVYATEFFNGYLDEIRVWNGVRSQTEIVSGMHRKLARTEGEGTAVTLEYYYNFDDCPDVDINWSNYAGVAVADEPRLPANINAIQRPGMPIHRTLYAWNLTPQRSQVYYGSNNQTNSVLQRSNQWNYVVMAEDVALHKAVNPPQDDKFHPDRTTNGTYTGTLPVGYKNSANPYENRAGYTKWAWERTTRDLVFLNGAQADGDVFVSVDSWIPGITINPDERDTDGDGMPDNWETENGLDPYDATGDNGAQGDVDNDGLTNIFEYWANLDPNNPYTDGTNPDGDRDMDADGLTNLREQTMGTKPLRADTDDDGLTDGEETVGTDNIGGTVTALSPVGTTDPLNSLDPAVRRAMSFDGTGRVIIPPQDKLMSKSWTIEMWVNPDPAGDGGVLISRYVQDLVTGADGVNYEMGLAPAGIGLMRPYVRYETGDGTIVRLDGTGGSDIIPAVGCDVVIPVGEWSHLASTYNPTNSRMELYIDGKLRAYRLDAMAVPPTVFGLQSSHQGDEVTLGALRSSGLAILEGYEGLLDELKFYSAVRSADEIVASYNAPPGAVGQSAPFVLPMKQGAYEPPAGIDSSIANLGSTEKVHAIVQFSGVPTQAKISELESTGAEIMYRVSERAFSVYGTKAQIQSVGDVRYSSTVEAKYKIASSVGSSASSIGRWVLVQFYPGTTESNALLAAAAAGVDVYNNKYLADTFLLAQCSDTQMQALAQQDSVVWITKAASTLFTGPVYLLDKNEAGSTVPAPFTLVGEGWDGPGLGSADLFYYFYNGTESIPGDTEQTAVLEQMLKWSRYAAITWTRGVYNMDFSCDLFWWPIDGPLGILALAYYPNDVNPETIAGDLFFDADEDWNLGSDIDLNFVALHELGHVLGIGHSDDPNAVMYPFYASGRPVELQADDIAALQSLYAKPDNPLAYFRFDDGGASAEDFVELGDWKNNFMYAGELDGGASFSTNAALMEADRDGDGMPDWWETSYGLDPRNDSDAVADPDGDGLTNLSEYQAGTNPQKADTDLDGLNDWADDSDGDTLSNGAEQDHYGSHPGRVDTDDDEINDRDEVDEATDPADSVSPFVVRSLRFGTLGTVDGAVTVSDRILGQATERLSLTNWTVECLVKPSVVFPAGGEMPLISRRVECSGLINYELGLLASGRPYVRFNDDAGSSTIQVSGGTALPTNGWSHLAARFSAGVLTLLVDGVPVGSDNTGFVPAQGIGDLVFGSDGFAGDLKEIRIWRIPRSNTDIQTFKARSLFFDSSAADPGLLRLQGNGSLREISSTIDPLTDRYIDNLNYWTLECWIKTTGTGTLISRWNNMFTEDTQGDYNYWMGIDDGGHLKGRFAAQWQEVTTSDNGSNTSTEIIIDFDVNVVVGSVPVNDGQWHHVAFIRDETNVLLYVDGEVDGKSANAWVPVPPANTVIQNWQVRAIDGPVVIGTDLAGDMDEIRIWKRGLSAQEISTYSRENLLGTELGLISYFSFDSQVGTNADERASVRDPSTEYGRYIPNAVLVRTTDGAPVKIIPLRTYRDTSLVGYFSTDDGGVTLEDFIHPNDWSYAGVLTNDVLFAALSSSEVPYTDDSDGDGLPDWWESANGLDPGSNRGDDGAWGDPDNDGLNNRAEFLAGTDPQDFDTDDDGYGDYDSRSGPGARTYGELYDDGDGMADSWEADYPSILSPLLYDADEDPDGDGWSNYGEFMNRTVGTNGSQSLPTDPTDSSSYPTPQVAFTFKYTGLFGQGPIRVQAYSTPTMDGTPDAELVLDGVTNFVSPYLLTTNQFTTGHLRQGPAWFYAYFDRNADGTWNEGEPAGLSLYQPIQVGFGAVPEVILGMSDELHGYKRFSWPAAADANSYTVSVWRKSGAAVQVISRIMKAPRTYFHEGDYRYAGYSGLPTNSYDWYVRAIQSNVTGGIIASNAFRIDYPVTLLAPVAYQPPAVISYARNTFAWSMDTNATQFRLQISREPSFTVPAALVFNMTTNAAYVDADGRCRYVLPIYAGDGAWSNGLYYWRVRALCPATTSAYSAVNSFLVNVQESPTGAYTIAGTVSYLGKVTNGQIVVQAFRSSGFSGVPEAQVTLTNKGVFKLMGLPAGSYSVRAFIDQNGDRALDSFESWGFLKDATYEIDYTVKVLHVPGNAVGQQLVIRDHDADDDGMPDAWEYQYFGNLATASYGTDFDGDGLTDLREYEIEPMDTDPTAQDTDGDGLTDYQEVFMDGSGEYTPWPLGGDTNPHLADTDGDGIPDGAEADIDGDGYDNNLENVLGSNPLNSAIVPPTSSLFVWGVSLGATVDVVTFDFDKPAVTGIRSNVQAKLMTSTNLMQGWTQPAGYTRNIYTTNWSTGPWTFNYTHPLNEAARSYYIDWMIKP